MEQPEKEPSASERHEPVATPLPDPTKMQIYRWKDDGGAIPPEPKPEKSDEA